MSNIVMGPPEPKPVAVPYCAKQCTDFRSIFSADEMFKRILECGPNGNDYGLHIATYTYNAALLDNFGQFIHRFLFSIRNGFAANLVGGKTRQLKNNHSKIIIVADKSCKKPTIAWLGSGNFVGPGVLYDFFVEIRQPKQLKEVCSAFDFVWNLGVEMKEPTA